MKKNMGKIINIKQSTINKWHGTIMKSKIFKQNIFSNIMFTLILMSLSTSGLAQMNLESVEHKSKSDGSVDFVFKFDSMAAQPNVFMTSNPARLAIDMEGVVNNSDVNLLTVSKGNTKSIRIVSTNKKTRAVIDLFQAAHHELEINGNEMIVSVFGSEKKQVNSNLLDNRYNVDNVDFRRGENGQGKIVLTFNKPGATVNLRETANRIKLEINSTDLPEQLDNKLDVVDFATPVSYVDVRARNGNVIVDISANGNFEHFAYQTGDQYVIEVNEIASDAETEALSLDSEIVYEGDKVSFNFQDIPVRSVLQLIADISDFNIVVSSSVQGSVTLRLTEVPWDQALDVVLDSMQLGKRQKGNVITISPAAEIEARDKYSGELL